MTFCQIIAHQNVGKCVCTPDHWYRKLSIQNNIMPTHKTKSSRWKEILLGELLHLAFYLHIADADSAEQRRAKLRKLIENQTILYL